MKATKPVTGAIIQARLGSSRLPGKVLLELIPGWTLIDVIVGRALRAKKVNSVIVATSDHPRDDAVATHCASKQIPCFRGSEEDVLDRMLQAAKYNRIERMIRLTGDNPLIDGVILDAMIEQMERDQLDYVATTMMGHSENWREERTFPRGISMELFTTVILEESERMACTSAERDAMTFNIYDHPDRFQLGAFHAEGAFAACCHPELRLTVDYVEDLELMRRVFTSLGRPDPTLFSTADAIRWIIEHPEVATMNAHLQHNIAHQAVALERSQDKRS